MEEFLKLFTPQNYKLKLDINKETEELKGLVVITGEAHADIIKLHAADMTIDEVNADYEYKDNILAISSADSKKNISIVFHKKLNHNMQGAYVSTYQYNGKTEKIVSTQFESHYARECFPCIDEPAAKATFDVTITTSDNDDKVLFNTEIINDSSEIPSLETDEKRQCFHFQQTPKMSTYLLAFVIGKFHSKSITNKHGVKITSYCALNQSPESLDHANQIAGESLDYYDDKFGIPYPLKKLDQVAIPDFEAGAMENWGLVTYRESCMLADKSATLTDRQYVATVVAHELSHQWFGNLVTMKWWDDLWLNESFANVIEFFAVDAIRPDYKIWEDFFTHDCLMALKRDSLKGVQSVHQPVNNPEEISTLFDGAIVYAKGAHLMLMLIRLIGEDKFFKGIHDYFKKYQYNNTVGDNLWESLQPYADFNVKDFMTAWISQSGFPVISGNSQRRFLIDGTTDDTKWPLPEIRDDMSGHYLINLSDEEFAQKLDNFKQLSLEQKLRLLIDRSFLAKTNLVPSSSLLDLLPYFKDETSHAVWSILARIIADLKIFCPPNSPAQKAYREYLKEVIAPQLERLGVVPKDGEPDNDTKLRSIILGIAHYSRDEATFKKLAELYNPDLKTINTEVRDAIIGAKLYLDENEIFNDLLNKYQTESDPSIKSDILMNLTDARQPENVTTLLGLLSKTDIVKPQDHLHLYIYLLTNHHTKQQTFDWLTKNWHFVEELTGEKSIEDYPRYTANSVRTKDEFRDFHNFFDKMSENPTLKRSISVADGEIKARLELISSDITGVEEKLGVKN